MSAIPWTSCPQFGHAVAVLRTCNVRNTDWRDEENRELDFVIERDGKLLAVEVKATTRPAYNDWKHLRHFIAEYKKTSLGGVLLHGGDETFQASESVIAMPWWKLL